jgi:transcriptional regulator with GAF, ATPase, and Fis domain
MDERRPGGAPPVMGLLERSDVMNELDGTLAGIAAAGGQAVLVSGEAGIGKSADLPHAGVHSLGLRS